MDHPKTIQAILDALALQQQRHETSLIATIEPALVPDAVNALQDYRTVFAPVIPGVTDTAPIYATYDRMRQEDETQQTLLLFVECQTVDEFREALDRLPSIQERKRRAETMDGTGGGTVPAKA